MKNKRSCRKKRVSTSRSKKASRRRKASLRTREDSSAQMTNYLLEPHPELGV
jgi:hypothetical protein